MSMVRAGFTFSFLFSLTLYASTDVSAICQKSALDDYNFLAGAKGTEFLNDYSAVNKLMGSSDLTTKLKGYSLVFDDKTIRQLDLLKLIEDSYINAEKFSKRFGNPKASRDINILEQITKTANGESEVSAATAEFINRVWEAESKKQHIQYQAALITVSMACPLAIPESIADRERLINECSQAAPEVVKLADTRQVWEQSVSFHDELLALLKLPKAAVGLAKLALTVNEKVLLYKNGGYTGQNIGNIFDDSMNSFMAAGFTKSESIDFTWVVLGQYAARGSGFSFLSPFVNAETYPTIQSLRIITAGLPLLAEVTRHKKDNYAYPKGFISNCSYGRPYHFWMGAYLTRRLMKLGYSPLGALATVHALGVTYEAKAEDGSNAPEMIALDQTKFYVYETHKDVAFKAAGAFAFATNFETANRDGLSTLKSNIDLDSILQNMFFGQPGSPIKQRLPLIQRSILSMAIIDPDLFAEKVKPDVPLTSLLNTLRP